RKGSHSTRSRRPTESDWTVFSCRKWILFLHRLSLEWLKERRVMPVINVHLAADLIVEGEQMRVFVWTIDHPAGRVLVHAGMIDSRPEVDDMSPTPHPENIPRDVACVVNTHLHYDHCGGNRLFPGVPIHVQARELADARSGRLP